jgi:hypothetical protein
MELSLCSRSNLERRKAVAFLCRVKIKLMFPDEEGLLKANLNKGLDVIEGGIQCWNVESKSLLDEF